MDTNKHEWKEWSHPAAD